MKRKNCIFLCYGTLKRGYWNNRHLGNAEYLGEFKTAPIYTLFDGGFPVVEREGNIAIQGELYRSNDEYNIQSVFDLEGCSSQIQGDKNNWYDFDEIDTPHGKAVIFVMNKEESGRINILNNGIWK